MISVKNLLYVVIFITCLITGLVAFHIISPDSLIVRDDEKVFELETGVNLEPIEEALGKT
jgi:hypothetical protein